MKRQTEREREREIKRQGKSIKKIKYVRLKKKITYIKLFV
jgi:hypothetical protein